MKLTRKTLRAKLSELGNDDLTITAFAAEGYNPAAVRELIRILRDKNRRHRGSEISKLYEKIN